jgi:hypothetical protein
MRDTDLAALKSENADLREQLRRAEARLEAVENKITPKPRPVAPIDEGVVRITTLEPYHGGDLPSPEQFETLLEIVARTHKIVPTWPENRWGTQFNDRQRYLTGFIQCFRRIGDLWRLPGSELGKHRAEKWANDTNQTYGIQADVNLSHFLAACIAWGDVNFSLGHWPFDVFAGLDYSSGRDVRPANPASWRAVLSSGKTRPQIIQGKQLYETPVPRIQQLIIRG